MDYIRTAGRAPFGGRWQEVAEALARLRILSDGWPLWAAVAAAFCAPLMQPSLLLQLTLWIAFGVCALSLDFVWGRAGIFSFGQNALFGVGGYTYAVVAINLFPVSGETVSALIAAALVACAAAAALGYLMFYGRVGDVFLSIITLAVTLILSTVMASTAGPEFQIGDAQLGGFNGMPSLPTIALPAPFPQGELGLRGLFAFATIVAGAACAGLMSLSNSRFGKLIDGLRVNETRMELLGHDTRLIKLAVFSLGGFVAGLGGGLFAAWGTFINPSVFGLTQAAMVVVWVMAGGRGSLFGAFLGVFLVQWAADESNALLSEQTPLIVGLTLVAIVFFLPGGVAPALIRTWRKCIAALASRRVQKIRPLEVDDVDSRTALCPSVSPVSRLRVAGLNKRFGGHVVISDLSASLSDNPIYAIIGPNGAGKSTFFNLLTGRHRADQGAILLDEREISALPPFKRARAGMGIKLQTPSIFGELTVRENIQLAIRGGPKARISKSAARILTLTGLELLLDAKAEDLSHGQQQWLEIAMVFAQDPRVILLDEPAAGASSAEKAAMAQILVSLSAHHLVVVVEHDMGFVRSLGAPTIVLHEGRLLRQGPFDDVIADSTVIDVYLGRARHAPVH